MDLDKDGINVHITPDALKIIKDSDQTAVKIDSVGGALVVNDYHIVPSGTLRSHCSTYLRLYGRTKAIGELKKMVEELEVSMGEPPKETFEEYRSRMIDLNADLHHRMSTSEWEDAVDGD